MSCLMEALQDTQVRLQPECKRRLQDRIDMWSYAAKVSAHKHKRHPGGQILHLLLHNSPTSSGKRCPFYIQVIILIFVVIVVVR